MNTLKVCIIILSVFICGCLNMKRSNQGSNTLIENVYGEAISWREFPVKFKFHNNFPEDKKSVAIEEVNKFNTLVGFQAIILDTRLSQTVQFKDKDGENVISWNNSKEVNFDSAEQAKTSAFWMGNTLIESDMKFNLDYSSTNLDFATLFRHELAHAMGMKHQGEGLMNPYLPYGTVREWDGTLVKQWVADLKREAVKGIDVKTSSLSSTYK